MSTVQAKQTQPAISIFAAQNQRYLEKKAAAQYLGIPIERFDEIAQDLVLELVEHYKAQHGTWIPVRICRSLSHDRKSVKLTVKAV